MGGFVGIPELILLALVVLLVFGPKRVPEIGRQVGKGMREFKQSLTGGEDDSPTEEPPQGVRSDGPPPVT